MAAKRRVAGPGRLGSKKNIRKSLSSGGGGHKKIALITEDEPLTVRFLHEPEDWYGYREHYNKDDGFFPCTEGQCCVDNDRASTKYLANAYVTNKSQVLAVKIPKTLMDALFAHYDKRATLLDRDYELSRSGSGMKDTQYMAAPESPHKMNISRYLREVIDLEELLDSLLPGEDDDDDDEPPRRSKNRRVLDEDDDEDDYEDDDDEEEDEEEEEPPRRRVAAKKSVVRKKTSSGTASRRVARRK